MDVSVLKMRLMRDREATKKADDTRELVDGTISMVRNVASHLRPAALNFGIVSALEWLVDEFNRRNPIPCELRIVGGEPALPDAHATAVFRIVQASLTNVAGHADAARADMTLNSTAEKFELQMRDDGRGFDPQVVGRNYSYELLGMNGRARLIGGSLLIGSAPGAGTTVSIHVRSMADLEHDQDTHCRRSCDRPWRPQADHRNHKRYRRRGGSGATDRSDRQAAQLRQICCCST
ncbi:hypothetical protein LMG24235_08386 [Paraburkholderia sabiae]|nr:hypothetical protein LMG24235_08386 [Paraburkholderia sabiae]